MCRARHEFLSAGYYRPFAEAIASLIAEEPCNALCDCGCGEGYYLRVLRERLTQSELIGIDLAKTSVKLAAKAERRARNPIRYAVAGIFDTPLPSFSFDAVLSIFAPIPVDEAYRLLKPNGRLLVAHPGQKHLDGLKEALYRVPYDNEPKLLSLDGFVLEKEEHCTYRVTLDRGSILPLFAMTPYYWKTSKEDADKLSVLESLATTLDFRLSLYRKQSR